jgi:hypothetical protein
VAQLAATSSLRGMSEPALGRAIPHRCLGLHRQFNPNASQFAADQRSRRAIFGIRFGQQWLYPSFQFDKKRHIRPEMREILSALSPDKQGWDRLQWFLEPHERLGGRTPLEVWANDPQDVLKAAQSEHWNARD